MMSRQPQLELYRSALLLLCVALGAFIGCEPELITESITVTDDETVYVWPELPQCTPGALDCACDDGVCQADLVCRAGVCAEPACTMGNLGCSCFANMTCNQDSAGRWLACDRGVCVDASCDEGDLGCGCLPGGVCDGDLVCDSSSGRPRCEIPDCAIGDSGCGCFPDRTCTPLDDGTETLCDGGVCVVPTCVPGEPGCGCEPDFSCVAGYVCGRAGTCIPLPSQRGELGGPCYRDGSCSGADLYCSEDGTCQVAGCERGESGCGCGDYFSCDLDDEGNPLVCVGGRCVAAPSDDSGYPGAVCFPNNTCRDDNRCVDGICAPCLRGSADCSCGADASCAPGLECRGGLCVTSDPESLREVPAAPLCYTPCAGGGIQTLEPPGFLACGEDGLIEGCIGDATCVDGSCLASPGDSSPWCTSDLDCPDFQACIENRCYSDCVVDTDCVAGLRCHRRVCRVPCSLSGGGCDAGEYCDASDGENGFCMATTPPDDTVETELPGGFTIVSSLGVSEEEGGEPVDLEGVRFEASNTRPEVTFWIRNDSPSPLPFAVRRVEHCIYGDSGRACEDGAALALYWVRLGDERRPPAATPILEDILVPPGRAVPVTISNLADIDFGRWRGTLEVSTPEFGAQEIAVDYVRGPDGRWTGRAYYFTSFEDQNLEDFLVDRSDLDALSDVRNGLLQRWAEFRRGTTTYDEWQAALQSIRTGSWDFASTEAITSQCESGACFPFDNAEGFGFITRDRATNPVPAGVVELPMSVNLRIRAGGCPERDGDGTIVDTGTCEGMIGRIVTGKSGGRVPDDLSPEDRAAVESGSLHYAGDPQLTMNFGSALEECDGLATGACLVRLNSFDADVFVGGRYVTNPADVDCGHAPADTFERLGFPWLVPGFRTGVTDDDETGRPYRYECRDAIFPYQPDPDAEDGGLATRNPIFSSSNPIPDGRVRQRQLELIDGALINDDILFVLFRESYDSFFAPDDEDGFAAYGYLVLERSTADVSDGDYAGNDARALFDLRDSHEPEGLLDVACSPDLVEAVFGPGGALTESNVNRLAVAILDGVDASSSPSPLPRDVSDQSGEQVHYYCEATGFFNGGEGDDGTATASSSACPPGSRVTFFTVDPSSFAAPIGFVGTTDAERALAAIAANRCNRPGPDGRGSCGETLARWVDSDVHVLNESPTFQCADPTAVFCDADRLDLRAGKLFYGSGAGGELIFEPLDTAIDAAFRYKTRFMSRGGSGLAFTPEICVESTDAVPYCYDPPAIEAVETRVDCLLHIFEDYDLAPAERARVREYLVRNFSYEEVLADDFPYPLNFSGFERLNSELLIMHGDEAFTNAFRSRFDLAGSSSASFEGSLFEDGGIDLSGALGFELYSLYLSTQYYQMVLDRFYAISPSVWAAINSGDRPEEGANFISQAAVTSYFPRLIRASSQKARAWSEVAKRYQNLNRPDLARAVIERAYTATYLESVALARLVSSVVEVSSATDRDQLRQELVQAGRLYRMALLDMRDVYADLTDDVNFWGYPPDYIPFPALDPGASNAFDEILAVARDRSAVAASWEDRAIEGDRSYETDAAQFQSELVSLRNTYENQLGDICGTFVGVDGAVYPAVPKYAHLSETTRVLGDPCGLVGNGQLFSAVAALEQRQLGMRRIAVESSNVRGTVDIERGRVEEQCGRIYYEAQWFYDQESDQDRLTLEMERSEALIEVSRDNLEKAATLAGLAKCTVGQSTDCPSAVGAAATFQREIDQIANQVDDANREIEESRGRLLEIDRESNRVRREFACDRAQVDSEATIRTQMLRLKELDIEALQADYDLRLALGQIQGLRNEATRLVDQQAEAEALSLRAAEAANDPNVRIYRNDAVVNADRAFYRAMREAYRATIVYEYYTGQSYAAKEQLFLIRLVRAGSYNLENYLFELEDAFREFEEAYGRPDTRVHVVSLRDDILGIPWLDDDDLPLSQSERVRRFRDALLAPGNYDRNGYRTFAFNVSSDSLSPLTINHKILHVEAEVIGSDTGDLLGRVYLRQRGTSAVSTPSGERRFFVFPERTAVLDAIFNGLRAYDPEIYRSQRLRDRPLVNGWYELVLNQRDEAVNEDIRLGSLTDIRLFFTYTDFTEL